MERIYTRSKNALGRTALLVPVLAAAAVLFIHAYPERPTAEASPQPAAEARAAVPEDDGRWLTIPKMARVRDLPVLTSPVGDEAALARSAPRVTGTGLPRQE